MQKIVNGVLQNPAARALILLVLIIPVSVYLGTTPVRRGFLYYTGVLAPAVVAAIAAELEVVLAHAWRMHRADHAYSDILLSIVVTRFSTSTVPLRRRGKIRAPPTA